MDVTVYPLDKTYTDDTVTTTLQPLIGIILTYPSVNTLCAMCACAVRQGNDSSILKRSKFKLVNL